MSSRVAVSAVTDDVHAAVREAMEAADWQQHIPAGSTVALKVNLGWDLFIPGSITSPLMLDAVAEVMQPHVGRLVVVEADQVLENIERAYEKSGMKAICERHGLEWINMTRAPTTMRDYPDNRILKQIALPKILEEALLVTLPVMKTHAKTGITGSLKNQWGCLPTMRHEYHLVLDDALADLNSVFRPTLAVMDATVGLEGNGPKSGIPRIADKVLCSADPVALDTIQATLMGIDPTTIAHLQRCADRGIGTNRREEIDVVGLDPEQHVIRFLPARHNAVSSVETLLRKSFFKKLFFNTPIFRICLWGAKVYYLIWTALQSRKRWREVLAHPLYGPQWNRPQ